MPLAYLAFAALTTSRANSELFGDERCSPPALLQHQEGVGRLYADIQGGPVRLGA